MSIEIKLLSEFAKVPTKKSGDAGYDLYAPHDGRIEPGKIQKISLDIAISGLPSNTYAKLTDLPKRSSASLEGGEGHEK